ncbi:MAG TPA: glucose-1-phosphate cytidylyltransferase [Elusimicrobia bacterium]|nr:glucose-1-phosphate cytidylyltransferase [Elusimicrobiota bacterium]
MKVVILAGGLGTRLSEETDLKPKPMVEIGQHPILWHIMKLYSSYGFNDFVLCLGYKGYLLKEYFANYFLHQADVTIDLRNNKLKVHHRKAEPWKVTLVDTGLNTMTGGRIKRIAKYVGNETFMLTYGDGVADVNMKKLVEFHKKHKRKATITAVQPIGRFGAIDIGQAGEAVSFQEKPLGDGAWINGGFFVLEPEVFKYIRDDASIWERQPLETLTREKQLSVYRHKGFWKCMDTLRDKQELENFWRSGNAPWKVWKEGQ